MTNIDPASPRGDQTVHSTFIRIGQEYINITADTVRFTEGVRKADKALKEFQKQTKKPKSTKPVDFNKFLRQLCKRRKK